MMVKSDSSETMARAIKRAFRSAIIEIPTERLDALFEGLNLKSLPEYRSAVAALQRYSDAAAQHYRREYEKREV